MENKTHEGTYCKKWYWVSSALMYIVRYYQGPELNTPEGCGIKYNNYD